MKITITGSLGHIGKPLTQKLVDEGHDLTVVSSNHERKLAIEALGAKAAIGTMEHVGFLTEAFTGADAVFCMIPPAGYEEPDRVSHYEKVANFYAEAIRKSGVERVVHLSSFGAHLSSGTGIIVGAYRAEQVFNTLNNVNLTHIRPTYFYYNLLNFIGQIKHTGAIASNYGASDKILLVSPMDIAEVVAEELTNLTPDKIRYIASDERTGNEIAAVIGTAIAKTDLKWTLIPDETVQQNMEKFGMPKKLAADMTEMFAAQHKGLMAEDYYKNLPEKMGKVKLEDYLPEFVNVYNQQ